LAQVVRFRVSASLPTMPPKTSVTPKTKKKPGAVKKAKKSKDHLFEKRPKNFRIGGDIQPRRDLTRFVKWPKYIQIQRKKRILQMRLKVPPAINQFSHTIDKNAASELLKLLSKYKPETRREKRERIRALAESPEETVKMAKKRLQVKYGLNHVTKLIEQKVAKLVVISHDVNPIDLVVWMPALCRKMDVAYCILRGSARLGKIVHTKRCSCLAVCDIAAEDRKSFDNLQKNFRAMFNDNVDVRRTWGGGIMGIKAQHKVAAKERLKEIELRKKLQIMG